jgi:DNA modification methylase
MKPVPYYDQDGITIYHDDCAKVLPFLDPVDLLLTDPPYGIGAGKMNLGKWRTAKMGKMDWDSKCPPDWVMQMAIDGAKSHIIWGGNYFHLPPARAFLVWDKGAGFKGRDFSECEQAWSSIDSVARILSHDPLAHGDYKGKEHPTQKPLAVINWCISFAGEVSTVLDPFMGSGTTLVAAKNQGKRAIGIERELKYCEIAVRRLAQQSLFQVGEP